MKNLSEKLFEIQDLKYREFLSALIPTVNKKSIIGVRTPELKKIAKEFFANNEYFVFLNTLPHKYFEENQIHGFIISLIKDFDEQVIQLEKFFPFINNWATCDQIVPKAFSKNLDKLFVKIKIWIQAGDKAEYEVRFAIRMLMNYFLGDHFTEEVLELVANIKSEKYYVQMMIAWFFATALAKEWNETIIYIEQNKLDKWVHNKTIQKARESYRITPEQKQYLNSLKR